MILFILPILTLGSALANDALLEAIYGQTYSFNYYSSSRTQKNFSSISDEREDERDNPARYAEDHSLDNGEHYSWDNLYLDNREWNKEPEVIY